MTDIIDNSTAKAKITPPTLLSIVVEYSYLVNNTGINHKAYSLIKYQVAVDKAFPSPLGLVYAAYSNGLPHTSVLPDVN